MNEADRPDAVKMLEALLKAAEAHAVTRVRVAWSGVEYEFERVPLPPAGAEEAAAPPKEPGAYEEALKREMKGGRR